MERDEPSIPDPQKLRLAANARFAANALDEALPLYSLAVEVARKRLEQYPEDQMMEDCIIHLCNLSACLYKMEMYEEACTNAAEAVSFSSGRNLKALFRLARAQMATKDYSSALDTIQRATSLCEEELLQHDQQTHGATNDTSIINSTLLQRKEFDKLRAVALREQSQAADLSSSSMDIKSIKHEPRTPSIKEFTRATKSSDLYAPLGVGNFSTVVVCQHKLTKETFALKIIEKEECKKLAKRQHPNVFNEVAMERRILTQNRLPHHINIIHSYHAMQGTLFS